MIIISIFIQSLYAYAGMNHFFQSDLLHLNKI
jgi:hypothetical protein